MATEFHGFISSYLPAISVLMLESALWGVGCYDVGENVYGRPLISKLSYQRSHALQNFLRTSKMSDLIFAFHVCFT